MCSIRYFDFFESNIHFGQIFIRFPLIGWSIQFLFLYLYWNQYFNFCLICLNYFSFHPFFLRKIYHFNFQLFKLNFTFKKPSANFHRKRVLFSDQLQHFASFIRIDSLILNHFQIIYLLNSNFELDYYFRYFLTNFHFILCFFRRLINSKCNQEHFKYHSNFSRM